MINAIIGAGGAIKPDESLAEIATVGTPKALLTIAGKRMVDWVLDAVAASEKVDNIIVVGLTEADNLNSHGKPLHFVADHGSLFENVKAGGKASGNISPTHKQVAWISADIPMISTAMLDWCITQAAAADHELFYTLIEKQTMEARFPNSKRTFTKLKGQEVCGGDINIFDIKLATTVHPAVEKMTAARKNVLRQAQLVGLWPAILLLTRQMTMAKGAEILHKRVELHTKFVLCPHAEVGMDVDKHYQYEIARQTLENL